MKSSVTVCYSKNLILQSNDLLSKQYLALLVINVMNDLKKEENVYDFYWYFILRVYKTT